MHAVAEREVSGGAASDVENVWGINESGIAVGRRQGGEDELARGDRHPRDLDVGGGDPRNRGVHDRQPPQQLLDGRAAASGSSRMAASWSGWRRSASVPSPNMFDVVSCPASSRSPAMPTSSSSVSSVPCSRMSMPRMSSPGSTRARRTSDSMYSRPLPLQLKAFGDGERQVELTSGTRLEVGPVAVGHAEQLADHQRRDGQREVLDQVHRRTRGLHRIEVLVDDLGDPGFEALDSPDGELRGEHAAQPLVFGRIEAEQVARPRTGLLLLRDVRSRRAGRIPAGGSSRSVRGRPASP